MSTSPESPRRRSRPEETGTSTNLYQRLRSNMGSVRQGLAIAGIGAVILGALVFLFLPDLRNASFVVMGVGAALLLIDAAISWSSVRRAVLGRHGRYGASTALILLAIVSLGVLLNFLLYQQVNRSNPPGWLRADTTATRQFVLSDQATTALENLQEPVRVTAFFTANSPANAAAWRDTEDLLSEFRRRSNTQTIEYRRVDPELRPNVASEYGVTNYPALAIEGLESRRTEVINGANPNNGPQVFTEQDVITGLLVVNQIRQKTVMFISGHAERDVTDNAASSSGFGQAALALSQDNYAVVDNTLQELGTLLSQDDPSFMPAAVVLANPTQDLLAVDQQVLLEYARRGGSILLLTEPNQTPDSLLDFLARYGLAVGAGEVVDTASFVAPDPRFVQAKASNGQIPSHEVTENFDVLYFPGSAYVAVTVEPEAVPLADSGEPYVSRELLVTSTLNSWAETSEEGLGFDPAQDQQGPVPLGVAVEAVSELTGQPRVVDGEFLRTKMIIIGDTDFASNRFISSARNRDLLVNSINWLADDYELISIRPRERVFRELVLTSTERELVRWTGWLLMPTLVGLAGVWMWWRRR
ncbi:MAG: GldG family protein [Dehalococcoidia bacterium]